MLPDESSAQKLADLFGITPRRISGLAAQGIIPKLRHGVYPTTASVRAYTKYLREAASEGGGPTLTEERARLTKSHADIAELKRKKLEGALLPREQVELGWRVIVLAVRDRLRVVPNKIAAQIAAINEPAEVATLLLDEIDEVLTELSRFDPATCRRHSNGKASDDLEFDDAAAD